MMTANSLHIYPFITFYCYAIRNSEAHSVQFPRLSKNKYNNTFQINRVFENSKALLNAITLYNKIIRNNKLQIDKYKQVENQA